MWFFTQQVFFDTTGTSAFFLSGLTNDAGGDLDFLNLAADGEILVLDIGTPGTAGDGEALFGDVVTEADFFAMVETVP